MKKIMVILLVSLLTASTAYAVSKQNCGCGLGTIIMEGQDGLISQVCAVTTNGTFGNQTFGITSGTLDCSQPASFTKNEKVNIFVSENMDNLAVDISAGEGESLNTFAELIEMPAEKRVKFFAALQENFDNIYTSPHVTHEQVIENIAKVVEQI